MEEWDTDEDGNIKVRRLHGYASATAPGNVLLRMLYFSEENNLPLNAPAGMQFVMTPDMARKFAADVIAAADQADKS